MSAATNALSLPCWGAITSATCRFSASIGSSRRPRLKSWFRFGLLGLTLASGESMRLLRGRWGSLGGGRTYIPYVGTGDTVIAYSSQNDHRCSLRALKGNPEAENDLVATRVHGAVLH